MASEEYEYDLAVIGGGSGGISCARTAAGLGAKVVMFDFVKPSTQGTSWGLGGTCVNVGCIPKKLMHQAALLKESVKDAAAYGWNVPSEEELTHSWDTLVDGVGAHIGSLNWGYRTAMRDAGVEYKNELASIVGPHTIKGVNRKKEETTYTAKEIVVAVGGRPNVPADIPGAVEHAMTSDDIFWSFDPPGKTLCVGASYVSLELASFLTGLGYDTTVAVRSILLRGFDQQMAEKIGDHMATEGTKFKRPVLVKSITVNDDGKKVVQFESRDDGATHEETFDSVIFATGRKPDTAALGLDTIGVATNERNGKIVVDEAEATNVPHVHAIGDCVDGVLELTPIAIASGKLLAKRLFGGSSKLMDYESVPTAVFTSLSYGAVGLSEEAAAEKYGPDAIEVYHTYPPVLEDSVPHNPENVVYSKLITRKADDVIVGIHYVGPAAEEIIQCIAIAVKLGATKDQFDDVVGVHPSISEAIFDMDITKASGKSALRSGC